MDDVVRQIAEDRYFSRLRYEGDSLTALGRKETRMRSLANEIQGHEWINSYNSNWDFDEER
jgi:hypothetical protein